MPSVFSRILMPEWNVPYNCYELGHTWTPFCSEAALEVGTIVFQQSLKLYAPLYLMNQVFQRKFDKNSFKECFESILRSSSFLGINAFLVILFFCLFRQVFGRFYYTLCAYMPSFFGSFLAIHTERPSRRRALAFYVANIASETLYRILLSRGYIVPLKHGQFLLLTTAITSLIYLFEAEKLQDPLIKLAFQLMVGRKVAKSKQENVNYSPSTDDNFEDNVLGEEVMNDETNGSGSLHKRVKALYDQLWFLVKYAVPVLDRRHRQCVHSPRLSCAENLLLNGAVKPFALGWLSQLAWRIIPKLLAGRVNVLRELTKPAQLFHSRHISFGLFLSTYATIYSLTRCLLCHFTNTSQPSHSIIAALAASPASQIFPSNSMTLYLLWKSIEAYFGLGAKNGYIPGHNFLVSLIYAISTAQLFYAAVLEPKNLKPSYQNFLNRVTENRLKYINRNVLEVFGTNASLGYETFIPTYDLSSTTRRFQESVLIWLL